MLISSLVYQGLFSCLFHLCPHICVIFKSSVLFITWSFSSCWEARFFKLRGSLVTYQPPCAAQLLPADSKNTQRHSKQTARRCVRKRGHIPSGSPNRLSTAAAERAIGSRGGSDLYFLLFVVAYLCCCLCRGERKCCWWNRTDGRKGKRETDSKLVPTVFLQLAIDLN